MTTALGSCGCDLLEGRCPKHLAMMRDIHAAWNAPMSPGLRKMLWSLTDAYGTPGYMPAQGYDWSGFRDSSIPAVEAIHEMLEVLS